MIFFIFGLLVGYLSWGYFLEMTLLSLSLFLVYLLVNKRINLFLFALGYYLTVSRGLLFGVEQFYHHWGYALLSWGGIALLSSLSWILLWSLSFKKRSYFFPFVLLLVILPPFGLISGANPLPTIALLFPKLGFLSLLLEIIFLYIIAYYWRRYQESYKKVMIMFFFLFSIMLIPFSLKHTLSDSPNIGTINSHLKYQPISFDKSEEYQRIKTFFYLVQKDKNLMTLLPENALGNYSDIQSMVWSRLDANRTIFAGATIYNAYYTKSINVLMELEHNQSKILYKQRVPAPIEMWKPFSHRGTEATLYEQPVVMMSDKKSGVFICYEQLLVYPYLQTFFYHPDMLIGISNLHWAKGTNIKEVQRETMQLWSLLFDVSLNFSVNE